MNGCRHDWERIGVGFDEIADAVPHALGYFAYDEGTAAIGSLVRRGASGRVVSMGYICNSWCRRYKSSIGYIGNSWCRRYKGGTRPGMPSGRGCGNIGKRLL